jgi:hypothetical protein
MPDVEGRPEGRPSRREQKAKAELGWTLQHPSWRQGFVEAYEPA